MLLSIGFSPCPNDTFMLDALVHHKIDHHGIDFDVFIEDVEQLNQRAFNQELDITKLSYHTFLHLTKHYQMLNAGSALGYGVGPLLIASRDLTKQEILKGPIALPGNWTTAHWLFSLSFPEATNKSFMLFSDIEESVRKGDSIAGVIIHENRFTYADRGFIKIMDLGQYWESTTKLPIPLGGIAVKRSLEPEVKSEINRLIKESVAYAFKDPISSQDFVRKHAQEIDEEVMRKHIELYVNQFSEDLGNKGRVAIDRMFGYSVEKGLIEEYSKDYLILP